ncbi:unnamed protein product [Tetraodon nigroviridis]|uniref:(spotted green pufferfish) hypothetical protein n=1 Tax=Tetraodon nigroviridis TaxID=99883 RepID=Q4T596_TETNG|nr:unnamed protein product [Tetraodon nigroviridis]
MVELSSGSHSCLVDEILHSIFFLGGLYSPPYLPKDILTDHDMLNILKSSYPQAFKYFQSKLPRRSPLSCVMDMIVNNTGQENEEGILSSLKALILELKEGNAKQLISSTGCVSQPNKEDQKSTRYYGVSMSTSECLPGRIVVAAACLSNWDEYVAGAVMTFYPTMERKTYFDGTIKLPGQVRCQAFNLSQLQEMPPCKSCRNLFGLTGDDKRSWAYGNCAENESVSNLLKKEQKVKEKSRPLAPSYTEENRKKAKESMEKELNSYLKTKKFSWDKTFYTPSE